MPCNEGTHSNATNNAGAADCSLTDSGYYAPTGSRRQTACPLGSYDPIPKFGKDDPNLDQCELCPAGKYADETSLTECKSCTKGNWCGTG